MYTVVKSVLRVHGREISRAVKSVVRVHGREIAKTTDFSHSTQHWCAKDPCTGSPHNLEIFIFLNEHFFLNLIACKNITENSQKT